MATATELTAWLSEAQLALHRLMTGSRVEEIESPAGRVRYTNATTGDLRTYISGLNQQIEATDRGNRKPIHFNFPA